MGVYLNPGNDMFKRSCHSEIYVDKTELITLTNKVINTEQNCVCISRPRRFGKSMAAYMLAAYYGKECDSSELFRPYKIAKVQVRLGVLVGEMRVAQKCDIFICASLPSAGGFYLSRRLYSH